MNFYIEIMLSIVAGAIVGFSFAYKGVLNNRQKNRIRDIDIFMLKVREILDTAVENTTSNNAILLSVHNNGGELLAGTPLFSSVIVEKPERRAFSVKSDWQEMPVDPEYFGVITKLNQQKQLRILTESMNDGGLLKIVYESMGVSGSFLFEVYKTNRSYYYVSFPCKGNVNEMMASKEFIQLKYAVNKLQNLCKNNDRKGVLK